MECLTSLIVARRLPRTSTRFHNHFLKLMLNNNKVAATLSYNGKIILITFGGDEHPTAVPHLYFKRCTIGFEFMFAKYYLSHHCYFF